MNKKAFTLIEMLTVIVLLGIIALITVPIISKLINKSEENVLETQKENVLAASKSYFAENPDNNRPVETWQVNKVPLSTIINKGYIEEVLNPVTEEACDYDNSYIEVGKGEDRKYIYDIYLSCGDYEYIGTNDRFEINDYKMKFAAKEYLEDTSSMPTSGNSEEVSYSALKTASYINAMYDPTSEVECDGKIIIENNSGKISYYPGLICDNYMKIDAWNLVLNPTFDKGEENWTATWSSSGIFEDNKATITGTGAYLSVILYQTNSKTLSSGDVLYGRTKAKVSNAVAEDLTYSINIAAGGLWKTIFSKSSPEANELYTLSNVVTLTSDYSDLRINIRHQYDLAETATGKIMEVNGEAKVILINLTEMESATGIELDSKTTEEIDLILENSGY